MNNTQARLPSRCLCCCLCCCCCPHKTYPYVLCGCCHTVGYAHGKAQEARQKQDERTVVERSFCRLTTATLLPLALSADSRWSMSHTTQSYGIHRHAVSLQGLYCSRWPPRTSCFGNRPSVDAGLHYRSLSSSSSLSPVVAGASPSCFAASAAMASMSRMPFVFGSVYLCVSSLSAVSSSHIL